MISADTKLTAQTNPELVSTDSSMTFHSANREFLRITNEARLIVGEGLSKDEATQEVAKMLIVAFDEQIQKMVDKRIAAMKEASK
jgi:cytoskeletal protein RodZ